jgi:hypothetical protein
LGKRRVFSCAMKRKMETRPESNPGCNYRLLLERRQEAIDANREISHFALVPRRRPRLPLPAKRGARRQLFLRDAFGPARLSPMTP